MAGKGSNSVTSVALKDSQGWKHPKPTTPLAFTSIAFNSVPLGAA